MSIRKALASSALLIFPLAFLLLYWMHVYFDGHPIARVIPSFVTFASLAVLILLEQLFQIGRASCRERV